MVASSKSNTDVGLPVVGNFGVSAAFGAAAGVAAKRLGTAVALIATTQLCVLQLLQMADIVVIKWNVLKSYLRRVPKEKAVRQAQNVFQVCVSSVSGFGVGFALGFVFG